MNRAAVGARAHVAAFHAIDGGAVIHHAAAQKLFVLNAPAALVWLDLRHGKPDEEITSDLTATFGIEAAQAADWFDAALTSFADMLAPSDGRPETTEPLPLPDADAAGTDYDFLGRRVRIAMPDAIRPAVESLLRGARRGDRGAIDLSIALTPDESGLRLVSSSGHVVVRAAAEIVAEVEAEIVRHVVPRVPHLLAFHAALLGWGERGVLLPGLSGAGKTTLSTVLATRGWRYATDEMAMLTRSAGWLGQPFPPCVKAVNYPRIERWLPSLAEVPELVRFGQKVRFAPVGIEPVDAAVSTVVFPRYQAGAATALEAMAPLDGLSRLLGLCIYVPVGFEAADVARLVGWHEGVRYFTLSFSDAESAAIALEMQMNGLAAGPF